MWHRLGTTHPVIPQLPSHRDLSLLLKSLPQCYSTALWFDCKKNAIDPLTWKARQQNNQGFPKVAGWMWAINTGMSFLHTHGYSLPEGQRTRERAFLHVNEPAFVKRPSVRKLHVFSARILFSYNNFSFAEPCIEEWMSSVVSNHRTHSTPQSISPSVLHMHCCKAGNVKVLFRLCHGETCWSCSSFVTELYCRVFIILSTVCTCKRVENTTKKP